MYANLIVLALLLCLLPPYIWTEYNWDKKHYFFTKMACSLLFVTAAVLALILIKPDRFYGVMIIIALCFGLIGDLLLVFVDTEKYFILGLSAFLIGQLVYGATFFVYLGLSWIDAVIYLGVIGITLIIFKVGKLKFGKMKLPTIAYLLGIDFMLTMAVSGLYKSGLPELVSILIAVGAVLFILSDLILSYMLFAPKEPKCLRALNLITYYLAQASFALSVAYMV